MTRSLEVGGAEIQLSLLARHLDPARFDVVVVTFYERGALLEELRIAKIPLHGIGKAGRWNLIGPYRRLVEILNVFEPDIVHSFLGPPNVMASLAKPRLTNCRLVWGFRASNMDLARYDWSFRLTEFLQRILNRRPDHIVLNSHAGREIALSRGFPAAMQSVIPNGIDTDKFKRDPGTGRSLRQAWGISPNSRLIGIVARLDPMKDHRTFLRAASLASRNDPDLKFICVGDGAPDYRAELKRLASRLGLDTSVIWTGERRDMPAIYSALDAATLTSAFGEGFPNAVGEAMACGVPCVVTDVGDAAIIVDETGIVVPPGQTEALANAWETLASETADQVRARAVSSRDHIVQNFSVAAMIQRHADLYQHLLAEQGGTR